jgi:hypothetical protein
MFSNKKLKTFSKVPGSVTLQGGHTKKDTPNKRSQIWVEQKKWKKKNYVKDDVKYKKVAIFDLYRAFELLRIQIFGLKIQKKQTKSFHFNGIE